MVTAVQNIQEKNIKGMDMEEGEWDVHFGGDEG